jgi:hypothetical protein
MLAGTFAEQSSHVRVPSNYIEPASYSEVAIKFIALKIGCLKVRFTF